MTNARTIRTVQTVQLHDMTFQVVKIADITMYQFATLADALAFADSMQRHKELLDCLDQAFASGWISMN